MKSHTEPDMLRSETIKPTLKKKFDPIFLTLLELYRNTMSFIPLQFSLISVLIERRQNPLEIDDSQFDH